MHSSRIAGKIRSQIGRFSGEVSRGLCKTGRRFVAEMIYGIQVRQSVMLSEVGRSLNEEIALKKTETRLSNQLGRRGLERALVKRLQAMAAGRIEDDTLLIVDISDIRKRYARKMEHLAQVRDGSTGEIGSGYWTVQVIGAQVDDVCVTPLSHHLYSQRAPDFVSENEEVLGVIREVSRATERRGIYVMDRGGDRQKLYDPLLDGGLRFIIRMTGGRDVIYRGRAVQSQEVARRCVMRYAERVVREKDGREKVYSIEYGFCPVRLPGRREGLYLVVVRGFGQEPMLLLTNVKVRETRRSCFFIVHAYIKRWQVEETIRCIKQSYDLENVRLLTYERLQNMMALVLCAIYFAAVYLGDTVRLEVLAHHALKAAKRFYGIPDFRYYALADGIKSLLEGFTKRFLPKKPVWVDSLQLSLFDP